MEVIRDPLLSRKHPFMAAYPVPFPVVLVLRFAAVSSAIANSNCQVRVGCCFSRPGPE